MKQPSRALIVVLGIWLCGTSAAGARAEGTGGGSAAAGATSAKKPATPAKAAKPASAKDAPAETVSGPEVRDFRTFCDEWMHKLHERETYNAAHIAWENHGGRISGEYVGYDTTCSCVAREEPGKDPIGKITYRETRYRREGATETEALAAPGTVLEQSDVTEIFRYGKGRWQY